MNLEYKRVESTINKIKGKQRRLEWKTGKTFCPDPADEPIGKNPLTAMFTEG
ncbi:MAG: hypothetical protein NPINA01_26830 [Nitrospinaceae bacterium]|nr:MAG: hypothetical protein NPINA01_26830 [Nitrospinaceae bacterium]